MKLGPMKGERGGVLVNEGPLTWVVLGMRCYGHEVGTDEGERGGVLVNEGSLTWVVLRMR